MSTDARTNETEDLPDSLKRGADSGWVVGDRGQRYAIHYTDAESGQEKVMGWTERRDGGGLLRSALQWPAVKERPDGTRIAWVVDRVTGLPVHD